MEKVIEPSEIIVDLPSIDEDTVHVNPWNRLLARFLDYTILSFCLSFTPFYKYLFFQWISLTYLIWVPVEAVLMVIFGYTPGKFLFKIKISHKQKKLNFSKSLRRSFLVLLKGIGLGIPIVMPIAIVVAYQHLYQNMKTTWDTEEQITTVQKPVSATTIIIGAIVVIGYRILGKELFQF